MWYRIEAIEIIRGFRVTANPVVYFVTQNPSAVVFKPGRRYISITSVEDTIHEEEKSCPGRFPDAVG